MNKSFVFLGDQYSSDKVNFLCTRQLCWSYSVLPPSPNLRDSILGHVSNTLGQILWIIVVKSLFGSVDFSSFQRSYGTLFNSEYFFFVNSITFCAYSVSSIVP